MQDSRRNLSLWPLALAIAAVLLLPSAGAGETIFLASDQVGGPGGGPTDVFEVNLDTLEATFLATFDSGILATDRVHAITICAGSPKIIGIGRDTGTVAEIDLTAPVLDDVILGALPTSFERRVVQLACSPDGTIYLSNQGTEELYTLDLATCPACAPALVGKVETAPGAGDVNLNGADMAFSFTGELFVLANIIVSPGVSLGGPFYRVDPKTAAAVLIGDMTTRAVNTGLAFTGDGRLITSNIDDHLYQIDAGDASIIDLGTLTESGMPLNIRGGDLASSPACPPPLHFDRDAAGNPLMTGQIIDDEWEAAGVFVSTNNPVDNPLMIFDSSAPTGGDVDLGTPHVDFGGPGVGSGGGALRSSRNGLSRGKILIISADGNSADPNDLDAPGQIAFDFAVPVRLDEVHIIDVERGEGGGTVVAFGPGGTEIVSRPLLTLGNNSFQVVPVGATMVTRLEINLAGSAGITALVFCHDVCN